MLGSPSQTLIRLVGYASGFHNIIALSGPKNKLKVLKRKVPSDDLSSRFFDHCQTLNLSHTRQKRAAKMYQVNIKFPFDRCIIIGYCARSMNRFKHSIHLTNLDRVARSKAQRELLPPTSPASREFSLYPPPPDIAPTSQWRG